ncbi:MAG: AlpA family transcriptional regulator [Hydrocarboniphaga sp.]|uniref:helix-turn-helix transcriptional regulator n=1 Tax=Hydrocarboniphaga sp. TaxID=2033016 RepID=UPI00261354E4|nr:AlpA family phage regulatory protein [Hydrocarboniphaga sp.]MDB5969072.1 AlpA family transcriptional regulator [Hydrocarboniphaga sp.]
MKLLLASDWCRKYFAEESMPDPHSVHGWIQKGVVPGETFGKQAYVDESAWLAHSRGAGDELPDVIHSGPIKTDFYQPAPNALRILRRRDLQASVRLSRSTIYDKINPLSLRYDATFPKPIRLGGGAAVGWLAHEVDAWLLARMDASRKTV